MEGVLQLFNLPTKAAVEKHCRELMVRSEDLTALLLGGRASVLAPYRYACHFAERRSEHLQPTGADLAALATNGVGQMRPAARKAGAKLWQQFKERRIFAAHLFYVSSARYWHLFYFDQRDMQPDRNHWKRGPHIHYSRESFTKEPLAEVWAKIQLPNPEPPRGVHIRYDYHHNRKGNRLTGSSPGF